MNQKWFRILSAIVLIASLGFTTALGVLPARADKPECPDGSSPPCKPTENNNENSNDNTDPCEPPLKLNESTGSCESPGQNNNDNSDNDNQNGQEGCNPGEADPDGGEQDCTDTNNGGCFDDNNGQRICCEKDEHKVGNVCVPNSNENENDNGNDNTENCPDGSAPPCNNSNENENENTNDNTGGGHDPVTICHSGDGVHYEKITVDDDGSYSGHIHHPNDLFDVTRCPNTNENENTNNNDNSDNDNENLNENTNNNDNSDNENPCPNGDYNGEQEGCDPPVLCTDDNALNFGQPAECEYPPTDPCEGLLSYILNFNLCWNGEKEKKHAEEPAICQNDDKIIADNGKDVYLFDGNLENKTNLTESLGGINTHPSFNQTNPCLEFVFGHQPNPGSSPEMWIYSNGALYKVTHDGAPIQGDGWDWSWDGKLIAYESDGYIKVTTPDGKTITKTDIMGSNPEWSPDGKVLAFSSLAGFMSAVNADWTHVRDFVETPMAQPKITPDQNFICGEDSCFKIADGPNVPTISSWGTYNDLAFKPSGDLVLTVGETMKIVGTDKNVQGTWFNPDWLSLKKALYKPIE